MLADHGREIRWDEYSDLDTFALHCARASEVVNRWPAWKQNLLDPRPCRDKPRLMPFPLKDAPRLESMNRLYRKAYGGS